MTGPDVAIIADDLTGSLDSAVPFALAGLRTVCATSVAALPAALASGARVVAVNLASREGPEAVASVRAVAAAQAVAGARVVLKKIDSRLKGHVAAEIGAVAAVLRPAGVVVCPAVPDLGRVVRDGQLEGLGVAEPLPVAARCGLAPDLGARFADAASGDDLDRLVAEAAEGTLFVGARGLATALARRMGRAARPAVAMRGPVAFVIGSRDPITLAQVERLRISGLDWVAAPDGRVPAGGSDGSVILQAVAGEGAAGDVVSSRLAEGFVRWHLADKRLLVLSGGETAAAVLDRMGVTVLEVLDEPLPGLPLCRGLDRPAGPAIVTKSGGFGAADALLRLVPEDAGKVRTG
ncbi:four-carbon acid sugar kinase family protein [Neotabrizicola shimadae]|uniref:Four-carbon acid sugar kinase family protein n=1 Tax=Neotabrizicola shimadae TaxID=2807096 RepID=A0A8G0ZSW8_9RHOB|nr:four-carbon acid sugar kinase family protein [Neotabrizicola shimadae]QYZ69437.1 four-carbon acid sugar kinase family protein [Neotabrizicola shimadae]